MGKQIEINDIPQTEEWIDVTKALPPANVIVKVLLTNNTEALDFVNLPLDKETPFQHYIVAKWRMATRDELNEFMAKANRTR